MNEFTKLLKEAFRDDAPFDPAPGREAMLRAVDVVDRRMRLVRRMTWVFVSLFTALLAWSAFLLFGADADTPPHRVAWYLGMFLLSMQGSWVGKTWFYNMQNHHRVMRELKRTQLLVLEAMDARAEEATSPPQA